MIRVPSPSRPGRGNCESSDPLLKRRSGCGVLLARPPCCPPTDAGILRSRACHRSRLRGAWSGQFADCRRVGPRLQPIPGSTRGRSARPSSGHDARETVLVKHAKTSTPRPGKGICYLAFDSGLCLLKDGFNVVNRRKQAVRKGGDQSGRLTSESERFQFSGEKNSSFDE